jgi:hypothetical protein
MKIKAVLTSTVKERIMNNKRGIMGQNDQKQVETLIQSAIKKINGKKENDICHYLPATEGGYIHHFTMRKMKGEKPEQLASMITKYIINASSPIAVQPKPRAARGSRKRRDQLAFTKHDLERMLHMARMAGDKDMIRKLTPRKDLRTVKRELISSIRHGRVEPDLWTSYVDSMSSAQALAQALTVGAPAAL